MDLRALLIDPGKRLPFQRELASERIAFPGLRRFLRPAEGQGEIFTDEGALRLRGEISARALCACDRCAAEFERELRVPLDVRLATELQDLESPDYFLLDGTELDLSEVLESCFILETESRCLCREDCKGLCPRCGADLNGGPCGCRPEKDPRLAVLEQLLDDI